MASETIDISEHTDEGKRRIVRHTFFGRDQKEAKHNERSHQRSDKFFKAAMRGKRYKGIKLTARKLRRKAMRKSRKGRRGGRY